MKELIDNPPEMLRTTEQITYFIWVVELLTDNGVAIKAQDAPSLATFAINLALLDECAESIASEGMMLRVEGDRGIVSKMNPAVAMQKEAQTALRFYFKEFQMSPTSRGSSGGDFHLPKKGASDGFDQL